MPFCAVFFVVAVVETKSSQEQGHLIRVKALASVARIFRAIQVKKNNQNHNP